MQRMISVFLPALILCLVAAASAQAASGRVMKVLPHLLDEKGRHTIAPSLYDRDAYQAHLRQHTNLISGIRFDVHWKVSGKAARPIRLKLEVRGTAKGNLPTRTILETVIQPAWFSRWTALPLRGEDYANFGELTAWRATLWEGDVLIGEHKSFLW